MKLCLPSKGEANVLLRHPVQFRGLEICDGALPPPAVLERAIDSQSTTWRMPRLFCDESSRQIVGSCGFKTEPRERRIEIGYNVSPAHQGCGYATEAVRLLVREAFLSGLIDEVGADTAKSNAASRRVLEKIGFMLCGSGTDSDGPIDLWSLKNQPNLK